MVVFYQLLAPHLGPGPRAQAPWPGPRTLGQGPGPRAARGLQEIGALVGLVHFGQAAQQLDVLRTERSSQRIASIVYAGRYGNGDASTGDGWRYRGHGLKQITFFDNHRACGQALGVD